MKSIYDNAAEISSDGDIEATIASEVNDNLHNHCHMENSGHGAFEHFGNRGYDKGTNYPVLDDYEIAIDITGFTDVDEENVKGHGTYVIGDSFGKADDESYRIDWIANFEKVVVENGKVYQVYSIRGNN